jgi:hypothetical protein
VSFVRRAAEDVGLLAYVAPMDWMCEPLVLAKTGLSVAEHQRRTVRNYIVLRGLAPDLHFMPVLQGWQPSHYLSTRRYLFIVCVRFLSDIVDIAKRLG